MLIENRRSYRLPFFNKIVLGTKNRVYSGSAENISMGGLFLNLNHLEDLNSGDECSCLLQLADGAEVLKVNALIKRLNQASSNPDDVPGVGIQFYKNPLEVLNPLREFIANLKKDYETLSTVLFTTEPELRSLLPIVSRIHMKNVENLAELKLIVDRTIQAIEHVEKKFGEI